MVIRVCTNGANCSFYPTSLISSGLKISFTGPSDKMSDDFEFWSDTRMMMSDDFQFSLIRK